ncbi:MAG: CPBP family intramembrane glutamic endopeptidase [Polyangiaceae bacterium]
MAPELWSVTSRWRTWAALVVVAMAVSLDLVGLRVHLMSYRAHELARVALGVGATLLVALLTRSSRRDSAGRVEPADSMGFRLGAYPSWPRLVLWGAVAVAIFWAVYALGMAIVLLGPGKSVLPLAALRRQNLTALFVTGILEAPIVEEPLYRYALCTAVERASNRRVGIAVSGLVFALLHVVYGTPSVVNALAGFFLAWIYYRSRSMLVPALAHGLGNGVLYGTNLAMLALLDRM